MTLFAQRVRKLGTENAFRYGPLIERVEQRGIRVMRCNIGEPDFPVPLHIRAEVKRQLDLDNCHYTDPQGIRPLREAVAHRLRDRGVPASADRVVVFPGAKPPIGFCQQTYCDPGDEVIHPSPGFPIYESFIEYVGAIAVPLLLREEQGFAPDAEELARRISPRTKLVILNFPSNPTGYVPSRSELEGLAEALRRLPPDARVYSDEVYEDIVFDGARHESIASVRGMAERTIVISGVSKSFAWTGGRVGWALFPTVEEAQVFKNLNINYFSCVPPYNQEGARTALESPESARTVARMVAAFQDRRDAVVTALRRIPGVRCTLPRGAFYAFPNVEGLLARLGAIDAWASLPEQERFATSPSGLFQMFLLEEYGVAAMDRRSFGVRGSEGQHHLRFSLATSGADLSEAVRRMEAAAGDGLGFARFVAEGRYRT